MVFIYEAFSLVLSSSSLGCKVWMVSIHSSFPARRAMLACNRISGGCVSVDLPPRCHTPLVYIRIISTYHRRCTYVGEFLTRMMPASKGLILDPFGGWAHSSMAAISAV